jgi:hypothetical protein
VWYPRSNDEWDDSRRVSHHDHRKEKRHNIAATEEAADTLGFTSDYWRTFRKAI